MQEENKCNCEEASCKATCDSNCNCNEETNNECNCGDNCGCTSDVHCSNHIDKKEHKKEKNKHKQEIESLKNANKKLEEEVLIAKADLVNYRKRKDEEVVRMLKFCNEDFIKQMLPVLDNFERAIKLDDDNLEDEVSKFLEGFKMIYCNMQNIMSNFEVKPIDGANKPFDPVYHNAIMVEHREGIEPGMVLEVLQKGYLYKDKVIRPAMVKVSE